MAEKGWRKGTWIPTAAAAANPRSLGHWNFVCSFNLNVIKK
jgi:hypothetical protein